MIPLIKLWIKCISSFQRRVSIISSEQYRSHCRFDTASADSAIDDDDDNEMVDVCLQGFLLAMPLATMA